MTKREREAIIARAEVLFEKNKITEAESYNTEALADIAYSFTEAINQLKRIADQGDKILSPTTLEKLDRLNLFLEYALKEDAKKPASDVGLVDAVKTFLDDEICGGYEKPTWEKHSVRHLQDALAAFEKPEVDDGA